uniref:Acyltransferase n=1 Tax=Caligus clemensi TaxID=344056 RepID=C1C1Q4_CALCM|nr:2-acylglycerol O-acyltransferase 1 [Caligus clemensi]
MNFNRFKEPFRLFGIHFAPLCLPLERRLRTVGALAWSGLIFIGLLLGGIVFFYCLLTSKYQWIIWPYLTWYIYDIRTPFTGGRDINGRLCRKYRNLPIWRYFKGYFPHKIIKTGDLDPNKSYLVGSHPHGLMASGSFAGFSTNDAFFQELYPNMKARVISASSMFFIPFVRELILALGVVSCLKNSMEIALSKGKGLANILIVGGALEAMNLGHKDVIKLYLQKRKGFIKIAIRMGTDIVPSFTFGENDLYHQLEHPFLKKIQLWGEKIVGFAPLVFNGRGIFQYSFGFLPLRKPLHVVIGSPIPVEMDPNPSKEKIEEVHRIYMDKLKELYDKYNPLYGDPNIKLEIG